LDLVRGEQFAQRRIHVPRDANRLQLFRPGDDVRPPAPHVQLLEEPPTDVHTVPNLLADLVEDRDPEQLERVDRLRLVTGAPGDGLAVRRARIGRTEQDVARLAGSDAARASSAAPSSPRRRTTSARPPAAELGVILLGRKITLPPAARVILRRALPWPG